MKEGEKQEENLGRGQKNKKNGDFLRRDRQTRTATRGVVAGSEVGEEGGV